MLNFAGRRYRTSDGRMGDHELEKKLRPTCATDFLGKGRQWLASDFAKKLRLGKWPVNQHCDTSFGCQRQQPLLGFALRNRIIHLNKIELLAFEHMGKLVVSAGGVVRHS